MTDQRAATAGKSVDVQRLLYDFDLFWTVVQVWRSAERRLWQTYGRPPESRETYALTASVLASEGPIGAQTTRVLDRIWSYMTDKNADHLIDRVDQ